MQDLENYLCLCEAATPGKWEVVSRGIDDSEVLVIASFNGISSDDDCLLITRQCKGLEDVRPAKVDAKFCAEAHEGWPKTIIRAMAAEKERDELRAILTEITDAVDRTVCRTGATPTLVEWCEMIGRARRVLGRRNHDHV